MNSSKKAMHRAAMLTLVTVVMAGSVFGQGRQRLSAEEQKEAFESTFVELVASLELSEEAAPGVKEVLWAQQEKRTELFASAQGSGSREGMREKMGAMQEETLTALADLLSADQLEKYQEIQESQRRNRGQRGGGQRRRPPQ